VSAAISGERIRALRKRLNLSQIELAQLLEVSNVTVNRWEHDRAVPQPATAERLLRAEHDGIAALRDSTPIAPGNLPFTATPLVGRTGDLARIEPLIEPGRVVTIAGTGGVGKTRLALELSRRVAPRFADGAWFVDLAAVSDSGNVGHTVGRVLGLRESGKQPINDRLAEHFREREQLIVLDNCEHVLAAVADLARRVPGSTSAVLATSRARLGFPGESVVALDPLTAADAAELFLSRAREHRGEHAVAAARDSTVDVLCLRLDRLPLAIELAAARTHVLSVEQITDRIDQRFELLRIAGNGEERRRALDAAIAWSWDLLQPEEAELLRRLSIFDGRFDLAAVEAVCDCAFALDLLDSLARQSMIVVEQEAGLATARYRLLDSLSAYAHRQLVGVGEDDRIADRHDAYFEQVASIASAAMKTTGQVEALATLDRNYENIRAALARTIEVRAGEPAIAFAASLARYWNPRGLFIEGSDWLSRALATAPSIPIPSMVSALSGRGRLLINAGRLDDAERDLRQSIALAERIGDRAGEAAARDILGLVFRGRSQLIPAAEQHQRSFDLCNDLGDRAGAATARLNLALIAGLNGDDVLAERGCHEAWALLRGTDDIAAEAGVIANLGGIVGSLGRVREAINYFDRAIELFRQLGDRDRMSISIANSTEIRCVVGDFAGALPLISEVEAQFRQTRNTIQLAGTLYLKGVILAGLGRQRESLAIFRESLQLYHELEDWMDVVYTLDVIARLHAERGDPRQAARMIGAAESLRETHRVPHYPYVDKAGTEAVLNAALTEAERASAANEGWAQSPDGIVAEALHVGMVTDGRPTHIFVRSQPAPLMHPAGILTARQAEILRLVAAGRSNRAIADDLAISPRTVERHLSTIFTLLDVDGRTAAVASATARGLL
jgi:predicted ATPase/DNA-binding CsgD family transcriptional regulator/DNA-binding XRE family transcriptional regulator